MCEWWENTFPSRLERQSLNFRTSVKGKTTEVLVIILFVCEIGKDQIWFYVDPTSEESSHLCAQTDSDVMKWNRRGRKCGGIRQGFCVWISRRSPFPVYQLCHYPPPITHYVVTTYPPTTTTHHPLPTTLSLPTQPLHTVGVPAGDNLLGCKTFEGKDAIIWCSC